MIFVSSRYSSIPGRILADHWLSSPQAAGGSSEDGHQTPEKRKQQAQGTLYCRSFDTNTTFCFLVTTWHLTSRQRRWGPSWPPYLHSVLPNSHRYPETAPRPQADPTPGSIAGLTSFWQLFSSWALTSKWWMSVERQQVKIHKTLYCSTFWIFSCQPYFSLIQLAPACSCWSRRLDSRTSVMLWTNSRFLLNPTFHYCGGKPYRPKRKKSNDKSIPHLLLFRGK